jgi:O-acetylserine/cysteine efflux transporter
MPFVHILLTLLVVFLWGINFIFVKFALDEISPLLFCTLRFCLASTPAIFFLRNAKFPYKTVISYGLIAFALQFLCFFYGMNRGIPPGLASLIVQIQVFFSLIITALYLSEKPALLQLIGAFIAFIGIGIVGFHCDLGGSLWGFVLILGAAIAWGFGNLITKKAQLDIKVLLTWGSFFAAVPLLIMELFLEGPSSIYTQLSHLSILGACSILYTTFLSTWVGYGAWNWLINKHPINTLVPFTLFIPLVAMFASVIVFNEPLQQWKILACILVLTGICLHLISSNMTVKKAKSLPLQV